MQSKVFEDYSFLSKLGQGSFGEVYLIQSKKTGEKFVLKTLKNTKNSLEDRLCTILNNKYIVKCIDTDLFLDKLHLIFEYANGGTLTNAYKNNKLTEKDIINMTKNILKALEYCHKFRICHRDIKPDNILIFEEKNETVYKLADWGLATEIYKKNYKPSGSLVYMAPELFLKNPDRSLCDKTDLWSLGVVVFVCMEKKLPFFGISDTDTVIDIINTEPVFKNCSKDCRDFIEKLLQKKPENRPSATEALKHKWLNS